LLALPAKVVGQIFLVAGKYPATVLIVAPGFSLKYHRSAFCAIILVRAPETQSTAKNTPGKAARFPEPAAEPGEQAANAAGSWIKDIFL